MQDVFKVMKVQVDLKYSSFDNYMMKVEYEEELAKEIAQLIEEAEQIVAIQAKRFEEIEEKSNSTKERLSNQTQEIRDEIRRLHIEYD